MRTRSTAPKRARTLASLVAAGALLAVPATGQAGKPDGTGKPTTPTSKSSKACAKTKKVAFTVAGTFVAGTPDDPATPASEASVTLKLVRANVHARRSGEIADQDAAKPGVQVAGAIFTVPAGDAFTLRFDGYTGTPAPSSDDRVKVVGKIALTSKRCAPAGTSTADRYGAVDVRKVTIIDTKPGA